jgi:peptide/nickel transport system substrate-binding protein
MFRMAIQAGAFVLALGTAAFAQQSGGNLVYLVQPEPPTLASYASSTAPIAMVTTKIYEGLVEYGFDLQPKPALAESWTLSPDGLEITFKLRQGVTFHDGKPFTSADAAFSIDTIRKVHPRGIATFREIASVETPDKSTLVLKLNKPAPYIMSALAASETPMLPKHLLESANDVRMAKLANAPVGTGPFKFVKWERGQYVLMEKNANYWRKGQPYLNRVMARFVPDSSTRAALLQSGEVQLAGLGAVPYNDVKSLAQNPKLEVTYKGIELISPVVELTLNTKHAPLNDVRVRQAISYAIDRKFVVENIFFGAGKPSAGPISSNFAPAGFYSDKGTDYSVSDRIEKAKALLDEAGLKPGADGIRLSLVHDVLPYGEEWRRFGERLQQDLLQIGIKVTLRNEDLASWLQRVYTTYDYQIASNHLFNLSDPVIGVHRGIHSAYIKKGTPFVNGSQWSSPETDALMDQATVEIDAAKRGALYRSLQEKISQAEPNVYVFELAYPTVINKKLHNAVTGPLGMYQSFHDAWLEK